MLTVKLSVPGQCVRVQRGKLIADCVNPRLQRFGLFRRKVVRDVARRGETDSGDCGAVVFDFNRLGVVAAAAGVIAAVGAVYGKA